MVVELEDEEVEAQLEKRGSNAILAYPYAKWKKLESKIENIEFVEYLLDGPGKIVPAEKRKHGERIVAKKDLQLHKNAKPTDIIGVKPEGYVKKKSQADMGDIGGIGDVQYDNEPTS